MSKPDDSDRPRIIPEEDGPFRYQRAAESGVQGGMENSRGESISCGGDVLLCRCGGSSAKPFCDSTHVRNGFSGEKKTNGRWDRRDDFEGEAATVHDNRGACAHVGYCTDELPEVFEYPPPKDGPWVHPDGAAPERVAEQTKRCPSGALSVTVGDEEERRDHESEPKVTVSKDGPYFVTGWVALPDDEPFNEGVSLEHYALCRCGASRNKPFCDGKHWKVEFEDPDN